MCIYIFIYFCELYVSASYTLALLASRLHINPKLELRAAKFCIHPECVTQMPDGDCASPLYVVQGYRIDHISFPK